MLKDGCLLDHMALFVLAGLSLYPGRIPPGALPPNVDIITLDGHMASLPCLVRKPITQQRGLYLCALSVLIRHNGWTETTDHCVQGEVIRDP